MPHTLQYRPLLIDSLISSPRINSYQSVFNTKNDVELMGVYLWNSHVCGALYPIISAAEVLLRNAIDRALVAHLGSFWWGATKLQYKSYSPGVVAPFSVRVVKENFASATASFLQERKKRFGTPQNVLPNPHGIVAKTEFSTWEHILDHEFIGPGLIWPSQLGKVFLGTWPSPSTAATLTTAKDLVKTVRDFRNRIFHHEPAWKGYGVKTEAQAIAHLLGKLNKIKELLVLIHPECIKLLEVNGLMLAAQRACTAEEIERFKHIAKTHDICSLDELNVLITTVDKNRTIVKVRAMAAEAKKDEEPAEPAMGPTFLMCAT